jgi:hypothetical protein
LRHGQLPKAKVTQLFQQGATDGALKYWAGVIREIDEAHHGSSWSRLICNDGPSFVAKVAELYYTINLNIAHLGLKWMEEGRMEIFPGVQKAVATLTDSRATNYWGIPHSWVPSQAREVKRMFRHAMFLRLWAVPNPVCVYLYRYGGAHEAE